MSKGRGGPPHRHEVRDHNKTVSTRPDNLHTLSSLTRDTVPPPPNGGNGPSTGGTAGFCLTLVPRPRLLVAPAVSVWPGDGA